MVFFEYDRVLTGMEIKKRVILLWRGGIWDLISEREYVLGNFSA